MCCFEKSVLFIQGREILIITFNIQNNDRLELRSLDITGAVVVIPFIAAAGYTYKQYYNSILSTIRKLYAKNQLTVLSFCPCKINFKSNLCF
jgi:glutathione peroxidase-family protein